MVGTPIRFPFVSRCPSRATRAEPLATRGSDEDVRVLAEQVVRRELLVDLQSDLQAEGPIVHGLRNRRRGINPSLAETRPLRLSAGFLPVRRFEFLTARVPAP